MTTPEKDPRAEEAARRWDELKALRAPHEPDWEDLARLIRPQRGGFTSANPAQARTDKPLSSAPIIAAITTSRPVRRPPSVRSVTRSRRRFIAST